MLENIRFCALCECIMTLIELFDFLPYVEEFFRGPRANRGQLFHRRRKTPSWGKPQCAELDAAVTLPI